MTDMISMHTIVSLIDFLCSLKTLSLEHTNILNV